MSTSEEARRRSEDGLARLAAQTEFRRPLLIEAGAGTGKTATLVARIVAWCMGPGWERVRSAAPPDGIDAERLAARVLSGLVAITFTEAAAAEMAQRVEAALEALEQGRAVIGLDAGTLDLPDEERALRARALLESLEYLGVHTIHAWCRGLLARFPLEAGLHPLFAVDAQGEQRERCVREEVEAVLREALADPGDRPWVRLAGMGIGPAELEAALSAFVAAGVQASDLDDPFAPGRLGRWWEELRGGLDALVAAGADCVANLGGRARNSTAAGTAVAAWRDRPSTAGPPADRRALEALRAELATAWSGGAMTRLAAWAAGDTSPTEQKELGDRCEAVCAAAARAEMPLRALLDCEIEKVALTAAVLAPLLERIQRQLERRGVLGFEDLLRRARRLLDECPAVRERLRREIDGLLVDEFQDTDRLQCAIVAALALDGESDERPWLFVVGDPKQSIYAWRSADLEAYESFRDRLVAAGGRCWPLVVNHRSDPPILEEVARVVRPVMRWRRGLQPGFEPLLASPERSGGSGFDRDPHAPVEHWACWPPADDGGPPAPDAPTRATNEIEARGLARDLLSLRAAAGPDFRWSEVAVLMRSLTDVDTYLGELRSVGIPYEVGRDRSYYRRREVIDAAATVRCILDPHDQLALLTCLRSPAVGVPDAALVPLWTRGLPGKLGELSGPDADRLSDLATLVREAAREVPDEAPGLDAVRGWEVSLHGAIENWAILRESFAIDPVDRFVERLRHLWLGEVTESARFLGSYRAANLERFHRELAERLGEGADPEDVLRSLREDIAREREVEGATTPQVRRDAVQVMSIHGAKGLTFDHVYLIQLGKQPRSGGHRPVEIHRTDGGLEWSVSGASTLGTWAARARAEAIARLEQVRALYVAVTRPRLRLVLSGRWSSRTQAVEPEHAPSLEALVANREGGIEDWAGHADGRAGGGGSGGVDARDVRWRLPALFPGGVAAADAPGVPDVAGLSQRAARSIALFRDQAPAAARRRMRPSSGSASGRVDDLERDASASDEPERDEAREARVEARFGGPRSAEGEGPAALPGARRELAMAVGTAVHRLLEEWDHGAPASDELERQRRRIEAILSPLVPPADRSEAQSEVEAVLDALASGGLLARLAVLAGGIVARELPVLRPPDDSPTSPVLFEAGVIDLVYRDPTTGEIVVADYKTDRAGSRAECLERAEHYREQGRFYTETLRDALGLAEAPRFELWFLRAGEIIR